MFWELFWDVLWALQGGRARYDGQGVAQAQSASLWVWEVLDAAEPIAAGIGVPGEGLPKHKA